MTAWSIEPSERTHRAAEARRRRGVRCGRLAQSRRAGRRRPRLRGRRRAAELRFGNGAFDVRRIRPRRPGVAHARSRSRQAGAAVTSRPRRRFASSRWTVRVTAREGAPLETEWRVARRARWWWNRKPRWAGATSARRGRAPTCASNWAAWATRRTNWRKSSWRSEGRPFAPASLLNRVRREAVERLQEAQGAAPPPGRNPLACAPGRGSGPRPAREHLPPQLHLLVRTPEQLEAALAIRARQHHARLPRSLRPEALARARPRRRHRGARGQPARAQAGRGTHRRFPAELRLPHPGASGRPAAPLARQAASDLIGDFSLNAANASSAEEFFAHGPGRAHAHARSQRRAGGGPGPRRRRRAHRSHPVPAPAGVPHRALRLLPLPLHRHELQGLRPSLRDATWWRCATMPAAPIR